MKKEVEATHASKRNSNFIWVCVILGVIFLSFLIPFILKTAGEYKIPQYFISTPGVLFLVLLCFTIVWSMLREQSPEYQIKQLQDFIANAPMEYRIRQKADEVIEEARNQEDPKIIQDFLENYKIVRDFEQRMFENLKKPDPKIKEQLDLIKEELGVI